MAPSEFGTLLKSGTAQSHFLLANAAPSVSNLHDDVASQQDHEAELELMEYCSFPEVRRLPHHATIEAQSRAWLFDLYRGRLPSSRVQHLLDTRLDALACVFYPHGVSDARSFTLSKLIHWFFILHGVFDDFHLLGHDYKAARLFACRHFKAMFGNTDETVMKQVGLITPFINDSTPCNAAAGTEEHICDERALYAASLAKAQQKLVMEIGVQWANEMRDDDQGMSPRQLQRLREAVAEYLAGIVGIVRLRQEKRLPSLEEYIRLRRMDGACKLALLGCEFDLGIELDEATLQQPLMKKLHATTADQLLWLNDLLSFINREYHTDDDVSLLPVLHYRKSIAGQTKLQEEERRSANQQVAAQDFQEAICEARAMIKAVDRERLRLAAQIVAWKPELKRYVEATHCTISGSTFWTLWSQRRGPM